MRATDVLIAGKKALCSDTATWVKDPLQSLQGQCARVAITEIDPICALQANMMGIEVVRMDDVVDNTDIFVTATGTKMSSHFRPHAADEAQRNCV